MAGRGGAWVGWSGLGRRGAGALRVRRHVADPGAADRGRGRPLLRGHVERLAVAAVPRRRREAGVPPHLVGHLRAGQQAVRRARRRRRRRERDRLGARLPAAAGAGAAPPAAARPHHRLLPAHPVPALRAVHPAALAVGDRRGAARRRPGRLPAAGRGVELRPARPPAARPAGPRPGRSSTTAARSPPAPSRSPSTSPRSTSWPAPPRCSPAPRRSARSSATRPRSSWASTGSTTPRASASGWPRSRSCSRTAPSRRPDTVLVQVATPSRERVEHYVHMRETIEQQVGHINGVFGSIAGPAVHYFNQSMPREELAALYRAADVMLVTPVPRRHEPGGQGVRRRARRPRRRAGAVRVRRRGRRAQAGVPGQPARHRRA